jgi:hypothetical protein
LPKVAEVVSYIMMLRGKTNYLAGSQEQKLE